MAKDFILDADATQVVSEMFRIEAAIKEAKLEMRRMASDTKSDTNTVVTSLKPLATNLLTLEKQYQSLKRSAKELQTVQVEGAKVAGSAAQAMTHRWNMMTTSIAFGLDDAIQQFAATGRASDALRAAGNNLTMIASAFGAIPVVATAAAVSVAMFWTKAIERSDDGKKKLEAYKKAMEDLREAEAKARGDDSASKIKAAEGAAWASDQAEQKAMKALQQRKVDEKTKSAFARVWGGESPFADQEAEYLKARDTARVAREGLAQLRKEAMIEQAKKSISPASEELQKLAAGGVNIGQMVRDALPANLQAAAGEVAKEINEKASMDRGAKALQAKFAPQKLPQTVAYEDAARAATIARRNVEGATIDAQMTGGGINNAEKRLIRGLDNIADALELKAKKLKMEAEDAEKAHLIQGPAPLVQAPVNRNGNN